MLKDTWKTFLDNLKSYNELANGINEGCRPGEIEIIEKKMGIRFPVELRSIYMSNNGQQSEGEGIFKTAHAYNIYKKLHFLDVSSVFLKWKFLTDKDDISSVYHSKMIPFAASKDDSCFFCMDVDTKKVILIDIEAADFTLPVDWQLIQADRGDNLEDFLLYQIRLY